MILQTTSIYSVRLIYIHYRMWSVIKINLISIKFVISLSSCLDDFLRVKIKIFISPLFNTTIEAKIETIQSSFINNCTKKEYLNNCWPLNYTRKSKYNCRISIFSFPILFILWALVEGFVLPFSSNLLL